MGVQYQNELEWKKHDLFFNNLNKQLDSIAETSANCLMDVALINKYRSWIETMINMYYPYITDDEQLREKEEILKKIQHMLHSSDYIQSIQKFNTLSPEKKSELAKKQGSCVRDLNKILRWFVSNISQHQLIPKPLKKKQYDPNKAILDSDY